MSKFKAHGKGSRKTYLGRSLDIRMDFSSKEKSSRTTSLSQPSHFFAWGNWFIRGNAYSLSYSGSTATETPATPKGTLEFRIVSVSAQTFLYSGREGPPFEETKLPHLPKNVLSLRVERTAMWKDKIMRFDQREKVPGLVFDRLRRGL